MRQEHGGFSAGPLGSMEGNLEVSEITRTIKQESLSWFKRWEASPS